MEMTQEFMRVEDKVGQEVELRVFRRSFQEEETETEL